ncbi:MAG: hypothetical protein CL887_06100 [Dehalococcoidia bacterium]|nr:hypothetical protein [Dehalococcoidia bacterium]
MSCGGEMVEVDSRPSDAIALAVRANVPIFASDDVIEQAGVSLTLDNPNEDDDNSEQVAQAEVGEEELEKLSAFTDFIDSLDLGDIGKDS